MLLPLRLPCSHIGQRVHAQRVVEGDQTDSPEEEFEKQGCYVYEPSSKSTRSAGIYVPKTYKGHDQRSFDANEPRNDHLVIFQESVDVDPAYEIKYKSENQAKTLCGPGSFQRRNRCETRVECESYTGWITAFLVI